MSGAARATRSVHKSFLAKLMFFSQGFGGHASSPSPVRSRSRGLGALGMRGHRRGRHWPLFATRTSLSVCSCFSPPSPIGPAQVTCGLHSRSFRSAATW